MHHVPIEMGKATEAKVQHLRLRSLHPFRTRLTDELLVEGRRTRMY